jgi:predicted TIM-barrel fold metal-dependent hydrolase
MDRNGVLASMCFPSMPGFSGGRLYEAADKDLAFAVLQAYNDWHVDGWCGAHPGRFIPLIIGPGWDIDATVSEIERMAARGARAISLPELPHLLGLPSYRSDYWFPVWEVVSDEDMVVCLHIAQGLDALDMGPEFPIDNYMVLATQVSVLCTQDLIWGPAMRTFPNLKFAFSEGGIGWMPFLLDRLDRHYAHQRWTGQDFGDKLPSQVFREHSLACFISDPTTLKLYRDIGPDIIAFEVDYPHSDSTWPDAPEELLRECEGAGMSDDDIDKVTWKNAARFCAYNPFVHIPEERATVGALRAASPDVDTAIVPRAEWRKRYDNNPRFEVASH